MTDKTHCPNCGESLHDHTTAHEAGYCEGYDMAVHLHGEARRLLGQIVQTHTGTGAGGRTFYTVEVPFDWTELNHHVLTAILGDK